MKKLNLKHHYHDSGIKSIEIDNDRICFGIELIPQWNNGMSTVHLFFEGVANIVDIREKLKMENKDKCKCSNLEIVGIVKIEKKKCLIDITGLDELVIDFKNVHET